uniref:DUF4806 domain-containing protein n=1 Tax=Strongyloides venezuelensis TaxID=75913 RepID=A0A0K0FRQ7_STRVS
MHQLGSLMESINQLSTRVESMEKKQDDFNKVGLLLESINKLSTKIESIEKKQDDFNRVIYEMKSNCKVDISSNEIKKSNFIQHDDRDLNEFSQSKFGSEWYANQYNDNKNMNVILSLLSNQSMKPYDPKEPYELYHAKVENYFELVKTPYNKLKFYLVTNPISR